jgi:hypothetical protein
LIFQQCHQIVDHWLVVIQDSNFDRFSFHAWLVNNDRDKIIVP